MAINEDKTKLLYKIAKAYYDDNLTYQQIGKRFGFSRMKVSRLLEQAKDEKIVQIIITSPQTANAELERKLEAQYNLDEAVIVTPPSYQSAVVTQALGPAGASYLLRSLQGQEIIGLSWGTALLAIVDALPFNHWPNLKVVPTTGGLGHLESETYGADLVRRMAQAFGARSHVIPAPGVVKSKLVHDDLMANPQISEALTIAARADICLVGIGRPIVGSVVLESGILTVNELEQLQTLGAVGDIVLRFFDADGRAVEHEINDRIIGLNLDHIRQIPRVIGIAGGAHKFEVIRGALRGKLVNVLITDDKTAVRLLEEAG